MQVVGKKRVRIRDDKTDVDKRHSIVLPPIRIGLYVHADSSQT